MTGHLHPLSQIIAESVAIFEQWGFTVVDGPEIETEFHNFDALNIPSGHPARTLQDTFWLKPRDRGLLLRTQTTAVDVRHLKSCQPPFRILVPGRVFRNEATDATHEAQFYQLDGLVVEEDVHLRHLIWLLQQFYLKLLGPQTKMRVRSSYFPFVEPGIEIDVERGGDWLEVAGAGVLHPKVFAAAGHDQKKWRGLAFGSAIDRLAMIKWQIPDIRLFYGGDLRFLQQF